VVKIALAASFAAHVVVFTATGLGAGHAAPGAPETAMLTIDVDVTTPAPVVEKEEEPVPAPVEPNVRAQAPVVPTHTHPYPVAPEHDARPHDPSLAHEHSDPHADEHEAAPAEAPATIVAPSSAPRFTMTFGGGAVGGGAVSARGTAPANGGSAGDGHDAADVTAQAIVPESGVSLRARLVDRAPLTYPFGAEDLEADVGLELVVDAHGGVESARVTRGAGHGFDEAALAAVRKYRFTPAERTGSKVRVRMPWVVQFRLAR
jgi:TonB family protein